MSGIALVVALAVVTVRVAHPDGGASSATPSGPSAPAALGPPDGPRADVAGWVDANGEPLPASVIEDFEGPAHCGWETSTWLRFHNALYIRDPRGVLRPYTVVGFDVDVALPPGARSTGVHEDGRAIWVIDDPSVIFVVTAARVEQWPRALDPTMGCQ